MNHNIYREQALATIARNVIKDHDAALLREPCAIPIEEIIENKYKLTIVYQQIRKTGKILGETAFDSTYIAVYDKDDDRGYLWLPVERGTIVVDAGLLAPRSYGRLRFTLAHELAHWIIHQNIYAGSGQTAAMQKGIAKSSDSDYAVERQADLLGSLILMPAGQIKKGFYRNPKDPNPAETLAKLFGVSKQAMAIRLKELCLV